MTNIFRGTADQIESNVNKVTVIDESANDEQYPSAKAVKDALEQARSSSSVQDGNGNKSVQQITDYATGTFGVENLNEEVRANAAIVKDKATTEVIIGALGEFSSALGGTSQASAKRAHAEGTTVVAAGKYSHAEGNGTVTLGNNTHSEGLQTIAEGANSHAEGDKSHSVGICSHAEGGLTLADGDYAHSEGSNTNALGNQSHAEGTNTTAEGVSSHAEGTHTYAKLDSAHAEGSGTKANGARSHAEGLSTNANGEASHSEGNATTAENSASHSEGTGTHAIGISSHSEGTNTYAEGESSHAEGYNTYAYGYASHSGGSISVANHADSFVHGAYLATGMDQQAVFGVYNDIDENALFIVGNGYSEDDRRNALTVSREGRVDVKQLFVNNNNIDPILNIPITQGTGQVSFQQRVTSVTWEPHALASAFARNSAGTIKSGAIGDGSVCLNGESQAFGTKSTSLGHRTLASGTFSVAQGEITLAHGNSSHAEGVLTASFGYASHAEGGDTIARGEKSHTEGAGTSTGTDATGAHAEGVASHALGYASHAGGESCYADHNASFAHGSGLKTGRDQQTVVGIFNKVDNAALFVVGNGTGDDADKRSNAFTVSSNGDGYLGGKKIATIDDVPTRGITEFYDYGYQYYQEIGDAHSAGKDIAIKYQSRIYRLSEYYSDDSKFIFSCMAYDPQGDGYRPCFIILSGNGKWECING